ncbi:23S ribosomal RNA methyltransferase [Exidia glandulosa HHB12029]|uniref:rRNA methyltransferase 2, mitochondrial n=1 Tax=Exidia glandulosa HHB12029 TaxID=1314781 RepID=A0A165IG86_EXIGL|nr:23S ribosomal RNA methyltransferase [Exidia glandulosa HHB12029]
MRATAPKLSKGPNRWVARQIADPYVRGRQTAAFAFRSRAAFKLLEIDDGHALFKRARVVADLGSAPGSWSQIAASKMGWFRKPMHVVNREAETRREMFRAAGRQPSWSDEIDPHDDAEDVARGRGTIIAVDLKNMPPITGVNFVQGDFLLPDVQETVRMLIPPDARSGKRYVDLILSDMGANMSGNRIKDSQDSIDLCTAAMQFAHKNLRPYDVSQLGGTLVMKHFTHPLLIEFRKKQLEPYFHRVFYIKPKASRDESSEGYWVCKEFMAAPKKKAAGQGTSEAHRGETREEREGTSEAHRGETREEKGAAQKTTDEEDDGWW